MSKENGIVHEDRTEGGTLCPDGEQEELLAEAQAREVQGDPRACDRCGGELDRNWPEGYCQECERNETEGRAEDIRVGVRAFAAILLLSISALGQTAY